MSLTPKDVEAIVTALETRIQSSCANNCFTEEECVMIKKWIEVMNSTSSWFVKLVLKFLLIVLGICAWVLVGSKWFSGVLSTKGS